ncbi:hypothetical protein ACPV5R_05165 [Vibrio astriarenae]
MKKVKSVWVKAPFVEFGDYHFQDVKVGSEQKEVKGNFLRKGYTENVPIYETQEVWIKTGISDRQIDGKKFNELIEQAVEELYSENYSVISITPVISGKYNHDLVPKGFEVYGFGYGFSYTEGVTILAHLKP